MIIKLKIAPESETQRKQRANLRLIPKYWEYE